MPLLKRLHRFSDIITLILLFLFGGWVGINFIEIGSITPQFQQNGFSPAVLKACGKGFVAPLSDIPALNDFLTLKTDRFSCKDLPEDLKIGPPSVFQKGHRYLMNTVALVWSVSNISWKALLPLYGIFFGATITLSYAMFRIGMGRGLAVIGAFLLTFSSLHHTILPLLRDYSKAPFILALVLIIGCMVKWPFKRRTILGLSGVFGAVLGMGLGFRMDILIFIPAFLLVVFLFLPGGVNKNIKTKVFALCLCLVIFLITGWPIIEALGSGSAVFHVILLGLMSPFDSALDIKGSIYEFGYTYSDGYIHSMLNSYSYRIHQNFVPLKIITHEYENIGMQYYFEILKHFPADMVIRSYASILKILKLPFGQVHFLNSNGFVLFLSVITLIVFRLHSLRVALYLLFIVIFLASYPMLQFSSRHFFHLEFISLWMLGFVLHQTYHSAIGLLNSATRKKWKELAVQPKIYLIPIRRLSLFTVSVFLILYGFLYSVRLYQQSHLKTYLQSYLAGEKEKIEFAQIPLDEEKTLITDFRIKGRELQGYELGNFPVKTNYFVAEFDGNKCKSDLLLLNLRYAAGRPQDRSRMVVLDIASSTKYFFPVYLSDIPRLQGIEIASKDLACLTSLSQIKDLQKFPLLLTLYLPKNWENKPLYQRLIYQGPKTRVYYYPETLELTQDREDNIFTQVSTPPSNDIIWNANTFKEIPVHKSPEILGLKELPGRMLRKLSGFNKWIVKGQSESAFAHLVVMKPRKIGKSTYFIAQGKLHHGGLSLGMVEKDKWALQVSVTMPGDFKIVILVPPGTYNPTLASCLEDSLHNDFEITKIGWVEK